jgi:flagellar assembly factor FliW
MPIAETRRFGPVEYDDSWVVHFPAALPGFENERSFVLLDQPGWAPIVFMQSLQGAELCFLAAPVGTLDPGYELSVSREDLKRLGLDEEHQPVPEQNVLCLALLCAPENGPLTANLLAPVVVNLQTRIAVQAVRADSRYSHQHVIGEAACL